MAEQATNKVFYRNSRETLEATFYEEGGIVYSRYRGEMDGESADFICNQCEAFKRDGGSAFPQMVDATELEGVTPEARKVFSERLLVKDSPVAAWAIAGCNFFMKSLVNLYARISHIPLRAFDTTEQAVAWLKGER